MMVRLREYLVTDNRKFRTRRLAGKGGNEEGNGWN